MKVTRELLRRYSQSKCTEAEIRIVENWLISADDDAFLSDEEIGNSPEKIKAKLFFSLFGSKQKVPLVPLYKKFTRYAAVACLVMLSFGVGYWMNPRNASGSGGLEENVTAHQVAGLKYKATEHSKIVSISNVEEGETLLRFDGDLIIVNDGPTDQNLVVSSATHHSPFTTKKFLIRSGQKYVVIHHHFKQEEVMVINVKNRDHLSPLIEDKLVEVLDNC